MAGTVYTEDKLEYTFFPVTKHSVSFTVKCGHDAHVALSSAGGDSLPVVEIFLGGWDNSKSAMRFNKEKPDKSEASTPQLFSPDEEKTFSVSWTSQGLITVTMQGASEPFLQWNNDTPFPIKYFGVRTAWGASGDWKIDGVKPVHTEDSMDYEWFPVHGAQIDFEVKAKNDAHLAFTAGPADETPLYEIFLGGWGNSKCALRLNKEKPDVAEAAVDGAVNGDEFKRFWVKLSYAAVQVGRDGETEPFLLWTNPEPILVSHFGIRTSWGADGHWRIDGVEGTAVETEAVVPKETETTETTETNELAGDDRPKRDVPEVEGVKWVAASGGEVPEGALAGGEDNGSPLYVARAEHEDAVIPGKLLAEHGIAYIPWGGEEHGKDSYEVLVIAEDAVSWVDGSGDVVPENAIQGGVTVDGEALYIGRTTHEGALTVGKFHPSHASLYISYGGAEIGFPDFQVLVKN